MKLTNEDKKLFKKTHDKWLSENKFLAKLFTRAVEKGISKNPNIKSAITKADSAIDNARAQIEKNLNGDKEAIKKAIPPSVRKYLGFEY